MTETKDENKGGNRIPPEVVALGNALHIVAEYLDCDDIGTVMQLPFRYSAKRLLSIFMECHVDDSPVKYIGRVPETESDFSRIFRCRYCRLCRPFMMSPRQACEKCDTHQYKTNVLCDGCSVWISSTRVTIYRNCRLRLCMACVPHGLVDRCAFKDYPELFGKCGGQVGGKTETLQNGDCIFTRRCNFHAWSHTSELFRIATTKETCFGYYLDITRG